MKKTFELQGRSFVILLLVAAMVIGGTRCQKPPETELAAAQKALGEAKAAEADTFAAAQFSKADEALKSAEKEIAAQDKKLTPLRKYAKARDLISRASKEAAGALAEASTFVSVTGLFVQSDGRPIVGMGIDYVEVEERGKDLMFKIALDKNSIVANPSVKTDADGRFLFKLHPSVHSQFLAVDRGYSLLLNVHGMARLLNIQSMPYILRFKGQEGQLARKGQIDIGRVIIEGY
jgi:hypothetical protein